VAFSDSVVTRDIRAMLEVVVLSRSLVCDDLRLSWRESTVLKALF